MNQRRRNVLPLNKVKVDDFFWNKYTRLVTDQIIPYQWEALNDRVEDAEPSHCIKNFEIAAGLRKGEFEGAVFQDTDLAKWLEAVAYSLAYEPDAELEKRADAMIDLIGKAQQPDGYLDTYFIIKEPDKKFCNLREGHELYTAGHFMEAAVAHYQVTGKEKFLHIMQRVADLICEVFHQEAFQQAVPGHEEVEIGLIRLYQVTGERRYLEMAKDFVDTTVEPVVTYERGLLGGTDVIRLSGKRMDAEAWSSDALYAEKRVPLKETELTLVPYCYWGNRKTGEMQTWMKFLQ